MIGRLEVAGRRVRVYMLVRNACTHDARVLREADALSRRGLRVTIIAVQRDGAPRIEQRQGFTIVRVPIAPWNTRFLRHLRTIPHMSTVAAHRRRRRQIRRARKLRVHTDRTRIRNAARGSARALHRRMLEDAQSRSVRRDAAQGQNRPTSPGFGRGRPPVLPPTQRERSRMSVRIWLSERSLPVRPALPLRRAMLRLGIGWDMLRVAPGVHHARRSAKADRARLRRSRRQLERLTRIDHWLVRRARRRESALRRRREDEPIRLAVANALRLAVRPLGWTRSTIRAGLYELASWSLLKAHRQFLLFDYSSRALSEIGEDLAWASDRGETGPVVIHAHDLNTLYPGTRAKRRFGGRLIYDSHELQLGTTAMTERSRPHRWLYRIYERALSRRADAVITVCQSIAEIMQRGYGLRSVEVVRNCPTLIPPLATHDLLRRECGISAHNRVAIYHGNLAPQRGLETLVESARYLDDVEIVLLGSGPLSETLPELAQKVGVGDRVHVHPAVLPTVLPRYVASADVAVVPIQGFVPNYYYSLPNKLFESMMAGLPVAASHLPEIRRVVEGERVGAIFDPDDPVDVARAINQVLDSPDYQLMCERAVHGARQRHHWGCEVPRLVALYDRVLGDRRAERVADEILQAS